MVYKHKAMVSNVCSIIVMSLRPSDQCCKGPIVCYRAVKTSTFSGILVASSTSVSRAIDFEVSSQVRTKQMTLLYQVFWTKLPP